MAKVAETATRARVNVRGLRQRAKRRAIFHFLHTVYPRHIAVLQETHSMPADAKIWKAEWGGEIMFSHSPSSNESGVAVLLPKSLYACCSVLSAECDDRGRLVVVSLQIETSRLKLFGVYAPTQSHNKVQIEFYENLREKLEALSIEELNFLVLCGDFNIHLGKLSSLYLHAGCCNITNELYTALAKSTSDRE